MKCLNKETGATLPSDNDMTGWAIMAAINTQ